MTKAVKEKPLYESHRKIPMPCASEITHIRVTTADIKTNTYAGDITIVDYIEHGITAKDSWEAKPGPQQHIVCRKAYRMEINPKRAKDDTFFGPTQFTLQSEIDKAMRHYIMHAILEVNPNLPYYYKFD